MSFCHGYPVYDYSCPPLGLVADWRDPLSSQQEGSFGFWFYGLGFRGNIGVILRLYCIWVLSG